MPGANGALDVRHPLVAQLLDPRSPINIDGLLDALVALVQDCNNPVMRRIKQVDQFVKKFEAYVKLISEQRLKGNDFELLKVIGRGAFGEVQLVRHATTRKVYAMKLLNKDDMIRRSDTAFFWEERNIMAHANSEWIVPLHYAFQDEQKLFMVMEFMPGGDLVNLMLKFEISEKWTRFYIAELVEALHALHSMGYIHRDVKPDNMLIARDGHIKLADFGTCLRVNNNGRVKNSATIGTPDYIAPEVLSNPGAETEFGKEVDWWSCGVVMYELLFGETPFYADSILNTYSNIMNFRSTLCFPEGVEVKEPAKDLIRRLLSDANTRLGRDNVNAIKEHPFFINPEWTFETLRNAEPPIIPELVGDDDTSNFGEVEPPSKDAKHEQFPMARTFSGNQLSFIGFTHINEYSPIDQLTNVLQTLMENSRTKNNKSSSDCGFSKEEVLVKQAELDRTLQEVAERSSELERQRVLLEQAEKKIADAGDQIQRLTERIHEFEDVEQQLHNSQRAQSDLIESLRRSERELKIQRDAVTSSEAKLSEVLEELEILKQKHCQTSTDLETERQEASRHSARLAETEKRCAALQLHVQNLEESSTELRRTLNKMHADGKENNEDSHTLRTNSSHEENLKAKLDATRLQLDTMRLDLQRESSMRREAQSDMEQLSNNLAASNLNVQMLQREIRKLQDEKQNLELSVGRGSKLRSELEEKFADLTESSHRTQDELVALERSYKELQFELQDERTKLLRLQDMQNNYEAMREQLESEKAARNIVEENLVELEKQSSLYRKEILQLVQRHDKEIKAKNTVIDTLDVELKETKTTAANISPTESVDLRDRVSELEYDREDLMKKLEISERMKKSAISKLEVLMNTRKPEKSATKTKDSVRELRIKDRELKNAQQQIQELQYSIKEKHEEQEKLIASQDELVSTLQQRCIELEEQLAEKSEQSKHGDNYDDTSSIASFTPSKNILPFGDILEGVVCIRPDSKKGSRLKSSKQPWIPMYAKLTLTAFCLFAENKRGGYEENPTVFIDAYRLCHARSVTSADVRFADPASLPKIFHIMYDKASDNATTSKHSSANDLSAVQLASVPERSDSTLSSHPHAFRHRHDFQELSFHIPTNCDFCGKKLSDLIGRNRSLECKNCRYKMHKDHNTCDIPVCKAKNGIMSEILLMAKDEKESHRWVRTFLNVIQESSTQKRLSIALNRNRTLPSS